MPDGSRYFSRTLADSGTMQKIQGSSDWRTFELPFYLMELKPESVTLDISVVMPGKGTIELKDITIGDLGNYTANIDEAVPPIEDGVIRVENKLPTTYLSSQTVGNFEFRPSSSRYVISGLVRHFDVRGAAYIEAWSNLPDGSRYLSSEKHLFDKNVWSKTPPTIQGTRGAWRRFELPFDLKDANPESVHVAVSVTLTGTGTVELREIEVSDVPASLSSAISGYATF
jgi:hypothetical protein